LRGSAVSTGCRSRRVLCASAEDACMGVDQKRNRLFGKIDIPTYLMTGRYLPSIKSLDLTPMPSATQVNGAVNGEYVGKRACSFAR
jgi:hypothetical protein